MIRLRNLFDKYFFKKPFDILYQKKFEEIDFGIYHLEFLYFDIFKEKDYGEQKLIIAFGEVQSGYGDWGFGITHTFSPRLLIKVNKNMKVLEYEGKAFYNSSDWEKEKTQKALNFLEKYLEVNNGYLKLSEQRQKKVDILFKVISFFKREDLVFIIKKPYRKIDFHWEESRFLEWLKYQRKDWEDELYHIKDDIFPEKIKKFNKFFDKLFKEIENEIL